MTLREIRSHNKWEVMTMLSALSRYNVLIEGQNITEKMRKSDPRAASLFNDYLDEVERYQRQVGKKNANESG
jgi:hypothetical protein